MALCCGQTSSWSKLKARKHMIPARIAACFVASTFLLGACSKAGSSGASSAQSSATVARAPAPPAGFPSGTQLGELGLPVFPTPPDQVSAHASEPNGDGGISTSTSLDPHAPFATVVEWYKAHMPADAYQPGGREDYAMFQIGKDGDKLIRIVTIQHIADHVQTEINLIKKTFP
jgi:hypothetical protein